MAIELFLYIFLLITGLLLFLFGASRESLTAGFIFIALSSVLFISAGALAWSNGVQTGTVINYLDSPLGTTPVYQVIDTNTSPALWALSNLFVYGGIGLLLLAFGLTVRQRRQARYETNQE